MNHNPELTEHEDEDEESYISTVEELASYLEENRQFATALIGALAGEAEVDSRNPINNILEKGYEDSFYMDALMAFNEENAAIVLTPMIEVATDWDQPFDDCDFGTSAYGVLEDIGVDEDLASDFRQYLTQECMRLVERNGRTKPDSGFVDIFGLKVYEIYKPLQAELQQKHEQEQQDEDEDEDEYQLDDGSAGEIHQQALDSAITQAVPLIAKWMGEIIQAEGESLVFNALRRMSSATRRSNSGDG